MSARIYLMRDGQPQGPFDIAEVQKAVMAGSVSTAELACIEGAQAWVPVGQIFGFPIQQQQNAVTARPAPRKRFHQVIFSCLGKIGILLGLVFVLFFVVAKVSDYQITHPDSHALAVSAAENNYYRGRGVIERNLKAPASAKWSDLGDAGTGAVEAGKGIWQTFGKVDAQNSFGALIRESWEVILEAQSGEVLYVRLGTQKSGDRQAALDRAK